MNAARDVLLAGAGLAGQQNRRPAPRGTVRLVERAAHRGTFSDERRRRQVARAPEDLGVPADAAVETGALDRDRDEAAAIHEPLQVARRERGPTRATHRFDHADGAAAAAVQRCRHHRARGGPGSDPRLAGHEDLTGEAGRLRESRPADHVVGRADRRRDNELVRFAVVQQDARGLGARGVRRVRGGASQQIIEVEKRRKGGVGAGRQPPFEVWTRHAGILPALST